MSIRPAELAGRWYPGDQKELAAELEGCLGAAENKIGRLKPAAGTLPVAVVAPHAGLAFSGFLAAAAYRLIADALGEIDVFVVFGACHRTSLSVPAVWAKGAWETPFGAIEVAEALAARLIEKGVGREDERPHFGDNAIEMQTPFIKRFFPAAKMLPIAISPFPEAWRYGQLAAEAALELGGNVMAVASTDLTHYGMSFGLMPAGVGESALAWTRRNDQRFIDLLLKMNLTDIVPIANRDASACGAGAAAAAAGWAKVRGAKGGRLLAYANSYELLPRGVAEHLVGYAAIAYEAAI
ncbi:MAG: AmmeMemoRadiSam system protein B [Planctomycetes bacterium]|nr:AmmeMemoRadiSam system protein B [Planctomycetota bacterium]